MATALDIISVDKIYAPRGKPPVHAVRGLALDIAEGEIVALLGSSGCGKTSTLRMIAGFEEVTRGEIRLKGRRIDPLAPAKRNIAMAFEGYSLYPPLTVRDNVAFALKAAKLGHREIDERVTEVSNLLEIGPILGRYPSSLSGGQQQRASLARALVRRADLHLLDEPMSQLEPQLRAVLRGRIKNYIIENGMTAVFVTHDQTEANALADRIAVMEAGELQQIASPVELKERPANLFVATFIGEPPMNVFPAHVEADGGKLRLVVNGEKTGSGFTLELPAGIPEATRALMPAGRRFRLGIRPHRIELGSGAARATIVSNQWLGDQSHIAAEVAGRVMVAVAHRRIDAPVGSSIDFDIKPANVHLFDEDSGRAVLHGIGPGGSS